MEEDPADDAQVAEWEVPCVNAASRPYPQAVLLIGMAAFGVHTCNAFCTTRACGSNFGQASRLLGRDLGSLRSLPPPRKTNHTWSEL